ncbi:HAUS augmin-like complex subunit 3 [Lingula anatina]|uniref:HAUS augmin-like complex subunit 3 n=1 Tax=Lingula anatina TaxID=7574 RepID=A0A1S3HAC5_LINAN|nr:HAUS augmin-like complex subunit 3 [Lingula anatina]XP_013382988.1 HAUS augmin-like complex subunit 3 [Lingula anatina]XP_013382989.1 HAUS augmin-like complex subunit 3 [Lingula anatina]|eukprot:XP_013382987.1 HAUS augmin-like complex subunit 3 [Lingula anatina]
MNGNQFLTTLKKLGYPQASNLDAQTFDWIFENDAVLPFLEWFCDHAHALNVLQDRELREYRSLEESTGVLEGPQLQDALNSIEGAEDDIPVAELREHVNSMKMELDLWRGRKESILRQRNKLSLHNTSVNHKLSKLGPMETVAKKDYKRCLEQSQADNSKVQHCNTVLFMIIVLNISALRQIFGHVS